MHDKLNFIKADSIVPRTGDIDIYHISKLDDGKQTIACISSPITPFGAPDRVFQCIDFEYHGPQYKHNVLMNLVC